MFSEGNRAKGVPPPGPRPPTSQEPFRLRTDQRAQAHPRPGDAAER